MTMKNVSISVCPVPPEQRPVNEYQELKESWFLSLGDFDLASILEKISMGLGTKLDCGWTSGSRQFSPSQKLLPFFIKWRSRSQFLSSR
jgi:hypothetical protein